jgi:hypothetical protein
MRYLYEDRRLFTAIYIFEHQFFELKGKNFKVLTLIFVDQSIKNKLSYFKL